MGIPEWRGKADVGTFPDLNHLLEGVERSELVLGGLDTSPEVAGGFYWVLGDNPRHNHSGTSPEVGKTARKSRFWHVPGPKSLSTKS